MIVYCCADLIFSTRIRAVCDDSKAPNRPARNVQMLENRLKQVDDGKTNLPVTCIMVDLDLGDDALTLISTAKAFNPAIPVIAFGAHVATELLQAARDKGADFVMPRGAFTNQLPQLVARFSPQ